MRLIVSAYLWEGEEAVSERRQKEEGGRLRLLLLAALAAVSSSGCPSLSPGLPSLVSLLPFAMPLEEG